LVGPPVPGQLPVLTLSDGTQIFHSFLSGWSAIGLELRLPLELITRNRRVVCQPPGAGKTLIAIQTILELSARARDTLAADSVQPVGALVVTRPELLLQLLKDALQFAEQRVAVLLKDDVNEFRRTLGTLDTERVVLVTSESELEAQHRREPIALCFSDWVGYLKASPQNFYLCVITDEGQLLQSISHRRLAVEALAMASKPPLLRLALTGTPLTQRNMNDLGFLLSSLHIPFLSDKDWLYRHVLLPLSLEDVSSPSGARHLLLTFMARLGIKHAETDIGFPKMQEEPIISSRPSAVEEATHRLLTWEHNDSSLSRRRLCAVHPALALFSTQEKALLKIIERQKGLERTTLSNAATERHPRKAQRHADQLEELERKKRKLVAQLLDWQTTSKEIESRMESEKRTRAAELAERIIQAADMPLLTFWERGVLYSEVENWAVQYDVQLLPEQQIRVLAGSGSVMLHLGPHRRLEGERRLAHAHRSLGRHVRHLQCTQKLKWQCTAAVTLSFHSADIQQIGEQKYIKPTIARFYQEAVRIEQTRVEQQEEESVKQETEPEAAAALVRAARAPQRATWQFPDIVLELREAKKAVGSCIDLEEVYKAAEKAVAVEHLPARSSQGYLARLPGESVLTECSAHAAKLKFLFRLAESVTRAILTRKWDIDTDVDYFRNCACHEVEREWNVKAMRNEGISLGKLMAGMNAETHEVNAGAPLNAAAAAAAGSGAILAFRSHCVVCKLHILLSYLTDHLQGDDASILNVLWPASSAALDSARNQLHAMIRPEFRKFATGLLIEDLEEEGNETEEGIDCLSHWNFCLALRAVLDAADGSIGVRTRGMSTYLVDFRMYEPPRRFSDHLETTRFAVRLSRHPAEILDDTRKRTKLRRMVDTWHRLFRCCVDREALEALSQHAHSAFAKVLQACYVQVTRLTQLREAVQPQHMRSAGSPAGANVGATFIEAAGEAAGANFNTTQKILNHPKVLWLQKRVAECNVLLSKLRQEYEAVVPPSLEGAARAPAFGAFISVVPGAAAFDRGVQSSAKFDSLSKQLRKLQTEWDSSSEVKVKLEQFGHSGRYPATAAAAAGAASRSVLASAPTSRCRVLVITNHPVAAPLLVTFLQLQGFDAVVPTGISVYASLERFQYDGGGFKVMVATVGDVGNGFNLLGLHAVILHDGFLEQRTADQAALRARRLDMPLCPQLLRLQTLGTVEQLLSYGTLPRELLLRRQQQIVARENAALTKALHTDAQEEEEDDDEDDGKEEEKSAPAPEVNHTGSLLSGLDPHPSAVQLARLEHLAQLSRDWGLPRFSRKKLDVTSILQLLSFATRMELPDVLLYSPAVRKKAMELVTVEDSSATSGLHSAPAAMMATEEPELILSDDSGVASLEHLSRKLAIHNLRPLTEPLSDTGLFDAVAAANRHATREAEEPMTLPTASELVAAVRSLLGTGERYHGLRVFLQQESEAALQIAGADPRMCGDWICAQLLSIHLTCNILLVTPTLSVPPLLICPIYSQDRCAATSRPPLHIAVFGEQLNQFAPLGRKEKAQTAVAAKEGSEQFPPLLGQAGTQQPSLAGGAAARRESVVRCEQKGPETQEDSICMELD
jgi:hypothetical protein